MGDVQRTTPWQDAALCGDWLEAAKRAAVSPYASQEFALAAATIALTEALIAGASPLPQDGSDG